MNEFVLHFRVQPSPNLALVLEIQTSRSLQLYNYETKDLVTCGWAKLELFNEHNQVHSGHWRLPFRSLPVQASLSPVQLNSVSRVCSPNIKRLRDSLDVRSFSLD